MNILSSEVLHGPAAITMADPRATNQFVTFTCGERLFGIHIMSVREIRRWSPTTRIPGGQLGACGVLDIRGSIVEIYDLASMLGAPSDREDMSKVVLVISLGDRDAGLIADTVSDIIFAQPDDLRPPPGGTARRRTAVSQLVRSEEQLIAILDLEVLFPNQEVH